MTTVIIINTNYNRANIIKPQINLINVCWGKMSDLVEIYHKRVRILRDFIFVANEVLEAVSLFNLKHKKER